MSVLKDFEKKYGQERFTTNTKMSKKERQEVVARAKRFTKGNISAWIRYSSTHHTPPKRALVSQKKAA